MANEQLKHLLVRQIAAHRAELDHERKMLRQKINPAALAFKIGKKAGPALLASRSVFRAGSMLAKTVPLGTILKGGMLLAAPLLAYQAFRGSRPDEGEETTPLPE